MKQVVRLLFETKLGDRVLQKLERLTGCALVDANEIEDVKVAATPKGKAATLGQTPVRGESRAPARD